MTPSRNCFVIAFAVLGVLSGVNYAVPLPAGEDDSDKVEEFVFLLGRGNKAGRSLFDQPSPVIPAKLPFSLELEPPLPDSSNGANKATVLPLRDSYGNPIPPSVLGVDPDYGLDAPKNPITIKETVTNQGIKFPIPSYASGITEIHRPSDGLLPPFKPSGGDSLLPSVSTTTAFPLPVTDLIPPLPSKSSKDDAINEISGTLTFNTPIPDNVSPSLIASVSTATTAISSLSTQTTTPEPIPVPIIISRASRIQGEKYTGGFGGAPGILGEQKSIGYDVSSTPAPFSPPDTTPYITTTTPSPPTTSAIIVTSTLPPPVRAISSSERSRIPIGVSPPSAVILALPAVSKVILPPFETYDLLRDYQNSLTTSSTSTTITTTTRRPTTTTQAPTTRPPTTTRAPTTTKAITTTPTPTTTFSIFVQPIDLENIPFPTTPSLEELIKGTQSPSKLSAIPTLSIILLPPAYSSNARPFGPPPSKTTTTTPPSALLPPTNSRGQDLLSLSLGLENTSTNESSENNDIGKALQERFGTSFSSQALPSNVNNLQPATSLSSQALPSNVNNLQPATNQPTKPIGTELISGLSTNNGLPQQPASSPVSPAKPISVPTLIVASVPVTGEPGKYTGGFGGAPGVLGEQKKPGFLIKPEAGAAAAAAIPALAPTTTTTTAAPTPVLPVVVAGSSGDKYTGGFGGPPGVLTPFDNVKKNS